MKEKDWNEFWRQVMLEKQVAICGVDGLENQFEPDDSELDSVLDMEINRGQLVLLVENIFTDAVRVGASDIHVVPRGGRKTSILFRVDGQLSEWYSIEDSRAEAVVAVVKEGPWGWIDSREWRRRMALRNGWWTM
jgi:type II secretory ATPase GspE/PulE/Tfp pilus assembly ATPase PilB-like protein